MSSLPFFFLLSWQAKQFSLRMGATSLMKLTGPFFGCWAEVAGGALKSRSRASVSPIIEHSTQWQTRERSMKDHSSKQQGDIVSLCSTGNEGVLAAPHPTGGSLAVATCGLAVGERGKGGRLTQVIIKHAA